VNRTVLILGAAGRFGRHAATAFAEAGWTVTLAVRPGRAAPAGRSVAADATDAPALARAAAGMDVIVNAVNPPYPAWAREVPRITGAVIAAARSGGATVLLPGNVYNFGTAMPPVLSEATPHRPDTRKGRIREELEAAYRAAGVPTILLRAGDFMDTAATGNWFESHITAKVGQGTVVWPGRRDIPHAWAWLPDLARAAVALAGRRAELPRFADIPFPGFAPTGEEMFRAMAAAAGRPLRVRPFPWGMLRLAAPFSPMLREVMEMRYLWDVPHRLDGTLLARLLPDFRPTPLAEAIRASLAARGLAAPAPAASQMAALPPSSM
jgi:nucleoside-diphosphate-sugar epimerase